MNKAIFIIMLITVGLTTQNTLAQEFETEIELIESLLGKAKKDFIADNITIPSFLDSEFWNLYNAYEVKRKQLARERVKLIGQYVFLYSEGENDDQGKFMNQVHKLNRQAEKNIKQTYKKIAKKVSPTTAMQFFQIEEYIRNAINYKLYENLPLKR